MKQVKICLGRFQPFTLGHLKMATCKLNGPNSEQKSLLREQPDVKEVQKQKTVLLVIETKPDEVNTKHPFDDKLRQKEFDIIKRTYSDVIEDIFFVDNADICKFGEMLKHKGYQASVWITGSDRYPMYWNMCKKIPEYEIKNRDDRDFKDACTKSFWVEELKRADDSNEFSETISGTKVREAIKTGDIDTYKKMMPKGTDKLFDEFKKALEAAPEPVKKTKKKKVKEHNYMHLKDYIIEKLIV